MNNLIKIFVFIFLIFPTILYSKDILKAKEGITWDSENQEYVATGNVEYESSDIKILSDYIKAKYQIENDKEIFNEIEIKGNIQIFYNEEIYYSDYGLYLKPKNIIELYDNVKIVSEDRILKGDELIIDLKNNTRTMSTSKKRVLLRYLLMSNEIQLKNINKKFKLKIFLKKINLFFDQKKIYGLLGPNGSGKTTLFNIIAGFLQPDSGEIYLNQKNLIDYSLNDRSLFGISYLPQEASIFRDLNVYQNILSIAQLFHKKANAEIITKKLVNLFSLDKFVYTKGKLLSGGERRRTEIARALASNPKYLLLDEPFAGIDPIAIEDVKETILKLKNSGIGIIITDHNVREALKIVDYANIIYNGEIVKEGTPNMITKDKFVKKIYLGENYDG